MVQGVVQWCAEPFAKNSSGLKKPESNQKPLGLVKQATKWICFIAPIKAGVVQETHRHRTYHKVQLDGPLWSPSANLSFVLLAAMSVCDYSDSVRCKSFGHVSAHLCKVEPNQSCADQYLEHFRSVSPWAIKYQSLNSDTRLCLEYFEVDGVTMISAGSAGQARSNLRYKNPVVSLYVSALIPRSIYPQTWPYAKARKEISKTSSS
ncbi:hypothetical protein BX666DRAFT_2023510 [Dichotomocladium elegans]|nr:hypothetical protein BX666DRAFT_2023510 [Dichotomocladium elegans]